MDDEAKARFAQMEADREKALAEVYGGSVVAPPGAGQRTPLPERPQSQHRPDGMLNGALVVIHLRSERGKSVHRCRVLEFVSVPAPHLLVELVETGRKRIFFCTAIDWIDEAEE